MPHKPTSSSSSIPTPDSPTRASFDLVAGGGWEVRAAAGGTSAQLGGAAGGATSAEKVSAHVRAANGGGSGMDYVEEVAPGVAGGAVRAGDDKQTLEIMLEDGLQMTVELDSGEKLLNDLGYKQELKRGLSFFEVFSIGINIVTFFAGTVPFYAVSYLNGGPVAVVWYWWITVFFTHLIALSFAEISSSFPISGSLYFWAAALAPPKHAPFAAWITGWLEFLGISVCISSLSFGGIQLLQYTIGVATGGVQGNGYFLSNYECFGVQVAAIVIAGLLNLLPVRYIGRFSAVGAAFQIILVIVMIVMLPCIAVSTQPASFVFTHYHVQTEETNVPNHAYAFVIAMQLSLFGLYAYDTVAHMAEETKRADFNVPVAMVSSVSLVSFLGWFLLVSLTFCIYDDEALLGTDNETGGGQPVVQIIWEVFFRRYGSGVGAVVVLILVYITFFYAAFSAVIGASRAAFSLSRDNGLPFSYLWRRVNRDKTPIYAVMLTSSIAILFSLPLLHSTTTFFAITSLATVAWEGSYAVPIFLRLVQKEGEFRPGVFNLKKYVGTSGRKMINIGALLFIAYTMATFMIPIYFPVTASNFNYASCVLVGTVAIIISWWFLDAKRWFSGPYHQRHTTRPATPGTGGWFA